MVRRSYKGHPIQQRAVGIYTICGTENTDKSCSPIMEQMKATEGATAELKCTCQMEWVQRYNNIHDRAEEIDLHVMVYS